MQNPIGQNGTGCDENKHVEIQKRLSENATSKIYVTQFQISGGWFWLPFTGKNSLAVDHHPTGSCLKVAPHPQKKKHCDSSYKSRN